MSVKRAPLVLIIALLVIGVVCFLPGFPPANHSFFNSVAPRQVEILAHGGGQGVAPTNTLLALQMAIKDGGDVLEVDVQLTKDNILVLHHDDTLDRTTDLTGPVASLTWAQLSQADKGRKTVISGHEFWGNDTKVAQLDDVLAALPRQRWNIEIKNNSPIAATQLCQSINRAGLQQRVLVASFHDKAMATFRADCPKVATSMAPNEIRLFVIFAHLGLSRFVKTPAVAVQVPVEAGGFDLTHQRFVAALKARNIKLHYWTINESAQMRDLMDAGADGLLTDFVVRGRETTTVTQPGLPEPKPSRP